MPENVASVQQQVTSPPKLNGKSFKLNGEKFFGYVLLVAGLLMIFAATYMVYGVLTGKSKPSKVFNVEAPTFRLPSANTNIELPQGATLAAGLKLNQDAGQGPSDIKLIPDEVFNGSLNIGLYYLAMMFLASSGLKVSEIGVKMIKDIKVQIKEDKQSLRSS